MVIFPGGVVRGRYRPIVISLIILANALVYFYTSINSSTPLLASSVDSFYKYGFIPYYLFTDPYKGLIRIFTSMFIHADIIHILFNMYFLWLFGSRLEGFIGHSKTLLLYLLSGLTAVLFHVAFTPIGGYDALAIPAVGASGAISGVLGVYLLTLPHTRLVMCWFFLLIPFCFSLSAEAFMIIWFIEQVVYGYLKLGGVAYFAHVGGFVMGLLLAPLLTHRVIKPGLTPEILRYIERVLGVIIPKPRGVSPFTKIILVLLLLGITGGFLYASLSTKNTIIYVSNVSATRIDQDSTQSDQVVLALTSQGLVASTSQQENVRILVNRLVAANLVFNTELASREVSVICPPVIRVEILGLEVPVCVNMTVIYDDLGVLVESSGLMLTRSVDVSSTGTASLGKPVALSFTIASSRIPRAGYNLSYLCLIAAGISILAVLAVSASRGAVFYTREGLFAQYL
jgi:membrane associated rhomboid family serine protease